MTRVPRHLPPPARAAASASRRRASSCPTCATSASAPLPAAVVPGAAGLDARLRRRRPDRDSPRSWAARRSSARWSAAAHEAGLGRDPRHRPEPHGGRRRQPLLDRRSAAERSSTSTRRPAGTGASSTSTTSPACARRTRRCSRRRTGWRCALVREGAVDGLRIDHPDGLADPAGYLRAAARRAASSTCGWRRSSTPASGCAIWPVEGTVGYEFLNDAAALFVDPAGEARADRAVGRARRRRRARSRESRTRPSSSRRRPRSRPKSTGCGALHDRAATSSEALASLPVYRTYIRERPPRREDLEVAARGGDRVAARRAARVRHALPADHAAGDGQGRRGHRLLPLPAAARAQRRRRRPGPLRDLGRGLPRGEPRARGRFPRNLLVTQTHDTKRSGDVRARIGALAGMAEEWEAHVRGWLELTSAVAPGPDAVERYLIFQTLVGAWPIEPERLDGYLEKALREAKRDDELDRARRGARGGGQGVRARALRPAGRSARTSSRSPPRSRAAGDRAALGQLLLKLTVPGAARHLQRRRAAAALARRPRQPPAGRLGRAARGARRRCARRRGRRDPKLLLIVRALALRARRPDAFAGAYTPIDAGEDVCAFARGDGEVLVVVPVRSPHGDDAEAAGRARRRVARRAQRRAARAVAAHAGDRAHLGARVRAARARLTKPPKIASAVCGWPGRCSASAARAASTVDAGLLDPVAVARRTSGRASAPSTSAWNWMPQALPIRNAAQPSPPRSSSSVAPGGGSMASSFQCSAHTGSGTSSSSAMRASSTHLTARLRQPPHAAAERVGEQLGAEADAEHRHVALDRPAQQLGLFEQVRVALDLRHRLRAAEADEPVDGVEIGQRVAGQAVVVGQPRGRRAGPPQRPGTAIPGGAGKQASAL